MTNRPPPAAVRDSRWPGGDATDKDSDNEYFAKLSGSNDSLDVDDDLDSENGEDHRLLGQEIAHHGAPKDALPIDEQERPEHVSALTHAAFTTSDGSATREEKPKPVSWSALPRKDQLFILTLARLSEPLTQTSLQTYMFYQLKSFDPNALDSTIAYQAGLLQAAFTGAQFCTAILWGRMADSEKMGRKRVILIGLLGTTIGALGFGFSSTFATAFVWRVIGGALNGNIGVMRTMISEIIREKKYQSRAFLLLPMTFNMGVIIGPVLGGLLADPVASYPALFGKQSVFGGNDGVWWMQRWPYALPNLVSAAFLLLSSITFFLGMEESLEGLRGKPDLGIRIRDRLMRAFFRRTSQINYSPLSPHEVSMSQHEDIEMRKAAHQRKREPSARGKLPFRRIWTRNVISVLLAHGMLAFHVGTFNNLWFVFLSTPRYNPSTLTASSSQPNSTSEDPNASLHLPLSYQPSLPFSFTGGLALPPSTIGNALAILGCIGIALQLVLYPRLSFKLGTTLSYRLSLLLFPVAYTLVPFLAIVPSPTAPPLPASGMLFWFALFIVLFVQVLARTFALPATTILVNNSSPHPSVLGSVHGLGQSVASAMRTLGPVVGGYVYGRGLRMGIVGLMWWILALWASAGAFAGCWVRDGTGHEIRLPGEDENEE